MQKVNKNGEIIYIISEAEKQQLDKVLKPLFNFKFEESVQ